ncbi:FAD-dependent oxidoreductase [Paenibacillus turpanensis]|uniref:FAD-dependent oxidoreductase n=1 Tax=Paenibacillus turpanensis TaxID=2689078 RepID=UPI001408D2BD|nr:FAD-dependent oxidoreductase [Paenibacillus turpanensis]
MGKTVPKSVWWIAVFLLIFAVLGTGMYILDKKRSTNSGKRGEPQTLQQVNSVDKPQSQYDLIVVGTDPEGIAAAVSGARNGLKTLLVDGRDREILGGLMTVGMLNSIDMVTKGPKHEIVNKGLFLEWFNQTEGDSFDVVTAANAFYGMVKNEKNIDLLMKAEQIQPLLEGNKVAGVKFVLKGAEYTVKAGSVVDATQDADLAAAAGVPFTFGREDIGDPKSKMAVTLVFGFTNVTDEVWEKVKKRLNGDDSSGTGANEMSAWGYGELHREYVSTNPDKVRMRGLNIGRQNDDTVLINALLVFGVDPLDPESLKEGIEAGKKELPNVIAHLKKTYPEFANIELGVTAPELYVRESRHIQGEYRLNIIDVLENRDHWDRIGFGGYPVDIQRTSPNDWGAVVSDPELYAIPFRTIVPLKVDGLLVVGRSASFDTLPHGSARVVPTGMAAGEAAGVAAKLVQEKGITFRELSKDKSGIAELQSILVKQGVDLAPYTPETYPFMKHKAYEGLKAAVTMSLAYGSYGNEFGLDKESSPASFTSVLNGFRRYAQGTSDAKLPANPYDITAKLEKEGKGVPLTLETAAKLAAYTLGIKAAEGQALDTLKEQNVLRSETVASIADPAKLTVGETYMLLLDLFLKLGVPLKQ